MQSKKVYRGAARRAFTLMELMIVIIILGLLAALVMPNLIGKSEEAKQKLVCVQMKGIKNALDMFRLDNGSYPDAEEGLEALAKNPDAEKYPNYSAGGYFQDGVLPKDPWKNRYIYVPGEEGINLISLGADRKEGGSAESKDITYAECIKQ
ncbi:MULTISPECIES: type II secretion system major pseudopilin GspG [Sulfurimonas]|uniref:Type II secretion system core protein G n=1 Tax=Sulfurimonas diazotrophicus TaxID=3131939 RepID=A0ABZ3HAE9_9BACT